MPSVSSKQQRFFRAVKRTKHDPNYGDVSLRKVADSMTDSDIDDFANYLKEFKNKKALLSVLKDCREPNYLQESDEEGEGIEPVSTTFHVKEDWSNYIKPYVGQPFSPKELEALNNFEKKESLTIARTEIWCKSSDDFNVSKTTVIKKMMDSGQFSYNSFQKNEKPKSPEEQEQEKQKQQATAGAESPAGDLGGDLGGGLGGLGGPPTGPSPLGGPESSPMGGGTPPEEPSTPSGGEDTPEEKEKEKEDIIVTKSVLFKDNIKGAAILIEFLKKLNL